MNRDFAIISLLAKKEHPCTCFGIEIKKSFVITQEAKRQYLGDRAI